MVDYVNKEGRTLYSPTTYIPYSCFEVTTMYISTYGAEVGLWDWCNEHENFFYWRKLVNEIPEYIKNGEYKFRVIGNKSCTKIYFHNFNTEVWDEIASECGISRLGDQGWTIFETYLYPSCEFVPTSYALGFESVGDSYQPIDFNKLNFFNYGYCVEQKKWNVTFMGNFWTAFSSQSMVFLPKALK